MTLSFEQWSLMSQGVCLICHGLLQFSTFWDYYNLPPPRQLCKLGEDTVQAWKWLKFSRDVTLGVIMVALVASHASQRELGIISSAIASFIFVDVFAMAANGSRGFNDRLRLGLHLGWAISLAITSTRYLYAPRPQACQCLLKV